MIPNSMFTRREKINQLAVLALSTKIVQSQLSVVVLINAFQGVFATKVISKRKTIVIMALSVCLGAVTQTCALML